MRILIPVDNTDRHRAVFDCLLSMKFSDPEIKLLNVVAPLPAVDSAYQAIASIDTQAMIDALREGGQAALDVASDDAQGKGLATTTLLAYGYPSSTIAETANSSVTDLIAFGAAPKGKMGRFFAGSVTHNLASAADQSLLVVRTSYHAKDKVSAVFATDHSDYANRCLEKLLAWKPAGLAHVQVLTAYESYGYELIQAGNTEVVTADEVDRLVKNRLCEKSEAVANRFREAGILADVSLVNTDIRSAIAATMAMTGADLLILGAKGHSMWERMMIGSTAVHELSAEPYSILVIRA
ncbi:MAG TPA: universal stress protein [Fimbriimonas sp.]|nr:universal stress protein [Fimbriimonas sp.]